MRSTRAQSFGTGGLVVWGMAAAMVAGPAAWAQAPAAVPQPHAAIPLWANGAPGSEGKTAPEIIVADGENERHVSSVNNPSLAPYLVRGAKTAGAAVVILPGGGHSLLSIDHEGYDVAKFLSGHGVAAFVLKYRLAKEKGSTYTVEGNELDDTQRAIRLVRARAAEWNVDPARVGVMGFSAGGELTLMAAMRASAANAAAADAVDRQDDKPSFVALMYPGGLSAEVIAKVTGAVPPAFMLCGADDRENIAQMLPLLFIAWRKAGVSAELHEYAGVGHGFGLRLSQHGAVADWPQVFLEWMDTRGYLRGK